MTIGICFLFAQQYHPSLRHAAVPRKELGVRTIFNMLGPLANPAGADRQLLGLYDRSRTETVAGVLQDLGLKRAMVVASDDGLDEISISGSTVVSELSEDGSIRTYEVTPEDVGLSRSPLASISGGSPEENAFIIQAVFSGEQRGACRDIVLLNAGACIYLGGGAKSLAEGVYRARVTIDEGVAARKLRELIDKTGELTDVSG